MECALSGNGIRGLHRGVNCLSRIGPELLIEAVPDEMILRSLNSARSAFLAITYKRQYFDRLHLHGPAAQCSVLLKAVCTVLRTQPSVVERLSIILSDNNATKLQFTVECSNGLRKTYWISCNQDVEMQHVAIPRSSFPSHLVARPRDLTRLLSNFQTNLQEITLIATEPFSANLNDSESAPEAKAVELRSYIDPVKENTDVALHTQLWIDPSEELREYHHRGDPVDVTYSVKELKAFMAFCEGCETDLRLYFKSAGSPISLAPKFNSADDGANADFDATLVLATMLNSQLRTNDAQTQILPEAARASSQQNRTPGPQHTPRTPPAQPAQAPSGSADPRSDHTVIWSDLSGTAGTAENPQTAFLDRVAGLRSLNLQSTEGSEEIPLADEPVARASNGQQPSAGLDNQQLQDEGDAMVGGELSNWVTGDDSDGDEDDEAGFCVRSTPPHGRA